jgi:hypothetical protein
VGKYSSTAGEVGESSVNQPCTSCPIDTYNPNTGSDSVSACVACNTAQSLFSNGAIPCFYCAINTEPNAARDGCVNCPTGKISAWAARYAFGCDICSAGKYAQGNFCLTCGTGKYSLQQAGSCVLCENGKFQGGTEKSSCSSCPQGTYAIGLGNSQCTGCAAGKISSATGATSEATCTSCAAGSASAAGLSV